MTGKTRHRRRTIPAVSRSNVSHKRSLADAMRARITGVSLPARERVYIEPPKVRDYLLSREHAVGRFKAAFFEALGYRAADWQRLDSDLRALAAAGDITVGELTRHGQKYEIRGALRGPLGRVATMVSIWIVRTDEEVFRFVTAFPGEKP